MFSTFYYTAENKPQYGALKASDVLTTSQKSHVVSDTLMCKWIRTRITAFNDINSGTGGWNGSSSVYELNASINLKQIVVITAYPPGNEQPYITSDKLTEFEGICNNIFDTYPDIKNVVFDNEPETDSFHSGPKSDYVASLQRLYVICRNRRIELSDGGIISALALRIRTYQNTLSSYGQTEADNYAINTQMSNHQVRYAKGLDTDTGFDTSCADHDALLYGIALYCDYANHHYYERPADDTVTTVLPNVFRYQKEYIQKVTGKAVITNEFGVRANTQPALVGALMEMMYKEGIKYAQYWDGTGDITNPARPLTDDNTGAIFANGVVFRDFVINHY